MPQQQPAHAINPTRLKTSLKMAISKLKFIQDKKSAINKQQRRQLATLLSQGKESSAKIRVENIIRDDIYVELLEYLELYCELLLARVAIILDTNRSGVDPSLKEAILSVVYSAPHSELKELSGLREIFVAKYGAEFGKSVIENTNDEYVPAKIVKRCQVEPPSELLVDLYLCEIAKAYEAPYSGLKIEEVIEESNDIDDDDDSPSGGQKEANLETPLAADPADVSNTQKTAPKTAPKALNDFDSLKARFDALKGAK
ncbi:DUF292-domain-containing protein [Hyphopichia burtonii NRRL Y-1933]|uniref:DUF292-domain-containing protein n=1 Tax=Hyphopichia burtonii NRRL Y-1933 TaxID=984485 RepID=A0A1E4RT70_9ASCO|nr:DUF292-domain-containing protein [Hyphopichia burtonii NRRL Y-1933]ODV70245.1 DUF292-domain-containing protein [Hyphopichia burtonii NRRL Y-1933]